ncbi:hypothetical protein KJ564_13275 [bacterium]|nr:hypothetical protein [bacterium]MBU1985507.1 hypothetical protein [bacterium]
MTKHKQPAISAHTYDSILDLAHVAFSPDSSRPTTVGYLSRGKQADVKSGEDPYRRNPESLQNGQRPTVRMSLILFTRPELALAREEIIPNLEYYHYRSGHNIDIFCMGFAVAGDADTRLKRISFITSDLYTGNSQSWYFDNAAFNSVREDFENRTNRKWRYSGGTDVIILNSIYTNASDRVHLDFGHVVCVNLETAKQEKAIASVGSFFERIIQYAETASGDDPTWGFSDAMGITIGQSALKQLILSLLPKSIRTDIKHAFHFYVKDISFDA